MGVGDLNYCRRIEPLIHEFLPLKFKKSLSHANVLTCYLIQLEFWQEVTIVFKYVLFCNLTLIYTLWFNFPKNNVTVAFSVLFSEQQWLYTYIGICITQKIMSYVQFVTLMNNSYLNIISYLLIFWNEKQSRLVTTLKLTIKWRCPQWLTDRQHSAVKASILRLCIYRVIGYILATSQLSACSIQNKWSK